MGSVHIGGISQFEMETSLEYWYPKIHGIGIPQPKTSIVKLDDNEIWSLYNEEIPLSVIDKVRNIAKFYKVPFFLRTDLCSAKHAWERSCYVTDFTKLDSHIHEIVVYNLTADILGLPFKSFIVREFLELESTFNAFYGNMPVSKERRLFIMDGEVICEHEYWVEDAIDHWNNDDWKSLLGKLNTITDDERELLTRYAIRVSEILEGYWSIDFAKTSSGQWILIDMGRGEISYHKPDCNKHVRPITCEVCGRPISRKESEIKKLCIRCNEHIFGKEAQDFEKKWLSRK